MPLIIGLMLYFAGAFALGLAYHLGYRKRRVTEALHLSAIFGMAVMVVVFVAAVVFDLTDLTPEPA